MELKELQIKINEVIEAIDKKQGVEHNSNNTFMHLIEEVGELANQLNKPNIRREIIKNEDLSKELADVFILLTRIANIYNVRNLVQTTPFKVWWRIVFLILILKIL